MCRPLFIIFACFRSHYIFAISQQTPHPLPQHITPKFIIEERCILADAVEFPFYKTFSENLRRQDLLHDYFENPSPMMVQEVVRYAGLMDGPRGFKITMRERSDREFSGRKRSDRDFSGRKLSDHNS